MVQNYCFVKSAVEQNAGLIVAAEKHSVHREMGKQLSFFCKPDSFFIPEHMRHSRKNLYSCRSESGQHGDQFLILKKTAAYPAVCVNPTDSAEWMFRKIFCNFFKLFHCFGKNR